MLYSHYQPALLLKEHVANVLRAAQSILANHSRFLQEKNPDLREITEFVARMHDTGKATKQFQIYIQDPLHYKENKKAKAHTAPSTWLVWKEACRAGYSPLKTLVSMLAVAGHHQGLHTQEELPGMFLDLSTAKFLPEQISSIDPQQACESIGIDISDSLSSPIELYEFLDDLEDNILKALQKLSLPDALDVRILSQLVLSILLEADKAFLAISEPYKNLYLSSPPADWTPAIVENYVSGLNPSSSNKEIDEFRTRVQQEILCQIPFDSPIHSLTLPTGMGKTLAAAGWAFSSFHSLPEEKRPKRIVIVLPYLSIIDQTVRIYQDILSEHIDPGMLLTSHSLSDRVYDTEMDEKSPDSSDFFIDTWHASIIITTFDQFLLAMMKSAGRYQMRFHNLCDALIILDEIQAMPCVLWHPLDQMLQRLAERCNTRILAMSATQPGFLSSAKELVRGHESIFSHFRRYRFVLRCKSKMTLDRFVEEVKDRKEIWGKRAMITMNTRKSAREVRNALSPDASFPLYFLTADVVPQERLEVIEKIKTGAPCVVVSTQCVEAGVDIDMDLIVRDFAPLDSLVQIAGRCNRNGKKSRCDVEIVYLENSRGRAFSGMIYDRILLQETEKIVAPYDELGEEEIYPICKRYFRALFEKKNVGEEITRDLAYLKSHVDPHKHLRDNRKQLEFLVIEKDPELKTQLEKAISVENRWERRRELRKLSGKISRYTVSVFAPEGFNPETVADPMGNFWLLKPGYYKPYQGIEIDFGEETCTQIF